MQVHKEYKDPKLGKNKVNFKDILGEKCPDGIDPSKKYEYLKPGDF